VRRLQKRERRLNGQRNMGYWESEKSEDGGGGERGEERGEKVVRLGNSWGER
jgi:hypothetical protein